MLHLDFVLNSMEHVAALAASVLLGIVGQVSLKAAAMQAEKGSLYFNPFTLVGLITYFVAALTYLFALQRIPLSVAFPSVSVSYVAVSYLAHLLWRESFGYPQIIALGLIGAGIVILSRN